MIDLPTVVLAFVTAMESVSGVPIAMLERMDNSEDFWARTAAILCEKTNDPFCEKDVRFFTSNTEPMGQSQIIEYQVKGGPIKRVCAIIPPIPNIDPSFVAEANAQPQPTIYDVPSSTEAAAWLTLYHAAHCLDTTLSDAEESRATALATLALTLMEGDTRFTPGIVRSPARMMAVMTGRQSAYWAAGTGERILVELWKKEAAGKVAQQSCYGIAAVSSSIDVEKIKRDQKMDPNNSCEPPVGAGAGPSQYTNPQVQITDANLWLWMYGDVKGSSGFKGLGTPPYAYTPFKTFPNLETAASYVIQTANTLSQ